MATICEERFAVHQDDYVHYDTQRLRDQFLVSGLFTPGNVKLNDNVADPFANTSWVVDDDRAQCPTASFTCWK